MPDFLKNADRKSRALLYTCFFAFFCNGTLALMTGSAMPDMKAAYGLNDTLSGLLLSAHSIGNLIAALISGLLPLYLGKRGSTMLMTALAAIGFVMTVTGGNPVWLFVAFAFTGLCRGEICQFNNAMVNKLSGGSAAASNLLHASFAVGALVTPLMFLLLSRLISWRAGVLYAAAVLTVSFILLSRMRLADDRPDRQDRSNMSLGFMKDPAFLTLAGMMFCYVCSEYALNGWLVTYLQSRETLLAAFGAGGDAVTAVRTYSQAMATLFWAVMLAGRLLCAFISGKVAKKLLMAVCSAGMLAFFIFLLVGTSVTSVTAAVTGLGLCMAGICPMIYADAAVFTNRYPLATGWLLAFGSAGGILMPFLVGFLADRFGFGGGMLAILSAVVLLCILSLINNLPGLKRTGA